jgi:hypothetical protein
LGGGGEEEISVKIKKDRISAEYSWKSSWIECVLIGFSIFLEDPLCLTQKTGFSEMSTRTLFSRVVQNLR